MTDPVVRTRYGSVRGSRNSGVCRFMSVPYAAPPVGTRRLRVPEPPLRWDGVRDARIAGANAPQMLRAFPRIDLSPLVGAGWHPGDDFLTLNIVTPKSGGSKLPVLVFIHGGAFVAGSSFAAVHAGDAFARDGIVYVAINYRLGVEGFLPIPGVPTNLGLRDQIAALSWVRDNIAAFGGDPDQLTVAGESAGAMSLANLIVSPLARGLIRRAIVQSGHGSMVRSLEVAGRTVAEVAQHLGGEASAEMFRATTLADSAGAVAAVSRPEVRLDLRERSGWDAGFGLSRFLPVVGDEVLPDHPLEALLRGEGAGVDLLIGTTREEMNIYLVPTGVKPSIGAPAAEAFLNSSAPRARQLLEAYGIERTPCAGDALCAALTDLVFRLPARRFAAAHKGPAHVYEFTWRSPACDGQLGACHGLELPFVFDSLGTCTGPNGVAGENPPQEMASRIHKLWVDFVCRGSLPWPEYEATRRHCHLIDVGRTIDEGAFPAEALS
ncbi:MAG TPA: carboxylesterase family protein [Steroidobacteraceae bacterium]